MTKKEFIKTVTDNLATEFLFNVDFSNCSEEEQEAWKGIDTALYITAGEPDNRTSGLWFLELVGKSLIFDWTDLDLKEFPENSEFNIYPQTVIFDFITELKRCL